VERQNNGDPCVVVVYEKETPVVSST